MAELPFLPLATDAYLADCAHLSDAEHGRYLLLLIALWRAPSQRLPNDDEWLARRFARSVERIQEEIRPLVREFCKCSGNWITQKRLAKEFAYVSTSRKKQSARAKSRWNKEKNESHGNAAMQPSGNALNSTQLNTTIEDKELVAKATSLHAKEHGNDKRHRLAPDWRPPQCCRDYATDKGLDADTTGESFTDWFGGGKGRNEQRTDTGWEKRWRVWCNTDAARKMGNGTNRAVQSSRGGDAFLEQLAIIASRDKS